MIGILDGREIANKSICYIASCVAIHIKCTQCVSLPVLPLPVGTQQQIIRTVNARVFISLLCI